MNFTEVVNEIVSITKRPDKITDIRRNVNSVISKACLGADFARDHDEALLNISSSDYAGNIALSNLARFRKINYILPTGYRQPIKLIDPIQVFDACVEQVNRFYISGDQINYKLSVLTPSVKVGWFKYPPLLTDAAPTFWLLDAAPYMVIDGAAAATFRNIGDDNSARQHEADWRLAYDSARVDLRYGANINAG